MVSKYTDSLTNRTSVLRNHANITYNIVLVDDHILLRNGLCELIRAFDKYDILFEADNGVDFIKKLNPSELPAVVLLDINMPEMDGYQTAQWIKSNHPEIKVLALTLLDNETAIIRMFKAGVRGYILKDCETADLKEALSAVVTRGFYYSEMITGSLIHSINNLDDEDNHLKEIVNLNEKEITFLKFACTELTYKEIADEMCVSPRTVDSYRDKLFMVLNVKTRVGLVMYAIRNGIVNIA